MIRGAEQTKDIDRGCRLGPYELVAPVGAGGMARVWAARNTETGRIVALKMLLPALAENVAFQQMFVDEARIASRVRHANVCSTFELGEQDGLRYLAMEWVDGPSLIRLIAAGGDDTEDAVRSPLRPRLAARIIADACAGLHAAHDLVDEHGHPLCVVHRDVSPHNILVTSKGRVKLTDFGVAKALGKSHSTIAGQLKGKLAYMAPEQLIGGTVDRRSDIFSLGCVLYEITLGRRPFVGEHDPQVMASIVMGRYEPPSALDPSYPSDLEDVIVRALASEPEQRFATAEQMRIALEEYLEASGPTLTSRNVAALVRERCPPGSIGRTLSFAARGSWLPVFADAADAPEPAHQTERSEEHGPASPRVADASASERARRRRATTRRIVRRPAWRNGMPSFALAVMFGATLGASVVGYVRGTKKARVASVAAAATRAERRPPADDVALSPRTTPKAPAAVKIRATPPSASLIVDGVAMPRGASAVARPSDGQPVTVTVHADGHEDAIVVIDPQTPDDVEVALAPLAPPPLSVSPIALQRGRDSTRRDATNTPPARKRPPPQDEAPPPETPPNPYD